MTTTLDLRRSARIDGHPILAVNGSGMAETLAGAEIGNPYRRSVAVVIDRTAALDLVALLREVGADRRLVGLEELSAALEDLAAGTALETELEVGA